MTQHDRQFKVMGGTLEHDVCSYIASMLQEQTLEVHVGCDSQNYKRHTVYVTTVVFRYPGNGAHVIYRKEKVHRKSTICGQSFGEKPNVRWHWQR